MIQARHLTKRYGNAVAVDDVSFVVQPGRVTGFLGPNGAGKPVTMRMIPGLDTPSSGSVLVKGVWRADRLSQGGWSAARRQGHRRWPQRRHHLRWLAPGRRTRGGT